MRLWLALCAAFAASLGCGPQKPVNVIPGPTCESTCNHLAYLRCPVADRSPIGTNCEDFCLPNWNLRCMERSASCTDAQKCVGPLESAPPLEVRP